MLEVFKDSEVLQGVLIGGLLGVLGAVISQVIASFSHYKQWKKEKSIENLRLKRDRLATLFKNAYEELADGVEKKSWPIDVATDFMVLFPESVCNEYEKFLQIDHSDLSKVRFMLADVSKSMKDELFKLDKEIESKIK